jgi:dipeptidyl-peptidase-4
MFYQAEKGYVIFTLDGRGSARRGFAFESIIHRQLGTVEIKDQMAGIAFLKSQPWVDTDHMAVHGWSFGGFMTGSLMLREPGAFRVGVAGGPVTDWKFYEVMYGERYMDRPEENPEGYAKASLLNHAANLRGDLLIIHGAMDSTVVMQHTYALLNEFIKNDEQVDFFVYPGHPHNVRGKDRLHLMQKILTYIDARIKEEDE